MPTALDRLARACDAVNEWTGRFVSWLILAMVVVTFAVVVLRYLFNLGWIALQESVTFMHALVFMLGAAYTLRHDGHVRVDILSQRLSPRGRAWVEIAGVLLLLVPVMTFLLWVGWDYVAQSWSQREGSRETGGLAGVFLLKTAILVMPMLMLVQGLAQALRSVLVLRGRGEAAPSHDAPKEL